MSRYGAVILLKAVVVYGWVDVDGVDVSVGLVTLA